MLYAILGEVKKVHPYKEPAYEIIKIDNKYVKGGIGRYFTLEKEYRITSYNVCYTKLLRKIKKESRIYLQETGKDPTPEILAKRLDMEPEKIKSILEMNQDPISLETPVGSEEDSELGDFVEDNKILSPYEQTNRNLLKEQLDQVLGTLSEREEKVLRFRYGLDDGCPRTLEEVGKIFKVTRERIRQIEVKALRKLRHPSRRKKLEDFKM